MIDKRDIQAACDDIVREFAPLQVILFGSYAYGTPTETSDVDLLVGAPTAKSERHWRTVETSQRIPRRFSRDMLVRSPEEVTYRLSHSEISKHAVATHYPGAPATAGPAVHALHICHQVRHAMREQLKLSPDVTVGETQ